MTELETSTSTALAPRAGSGEMFDRIAERYDTLNRIISLGIDQGWRRRTARSLGLEGREAPFVVDLATGTGDLAITIARQWPTSRVVGIDPSREMMRYGTSKLARLQLSSRVELRYGDAQAIELDSDSVDAVTIAFGIRNVPDRARGLSEMNRILKPGAIAAILELGEPKNGLLGPFARFHIRHVVPTIGALLSGKKEYRYLQSSIAAFPEPDEFLSMMKTAGFSEVRVVPLTFGVCNLYLGKASGSSGEAR